MYTYEIVFRHLEKGKNKKKLLDISECICTENSYQALEYAKSQLDLFNDYELIGIIRRNPIIKIIKDK
jgi:hypothetical protein